MHSICVNCIHDCFCYVASFVEFYLDWFLSRTVHERQQIGCSQCFITPAYRGFQKSCLCLRHITSSRSPPLSSRYLGIGTVGGASSVPSDETSKGGATICCDVRLCSSVPHPLIIFFAFCNRQWFL